MEPTAPVPPPSPPPSEPVAPRLRFRRQIRSPANPLIDMPVEILERCARFSERRTYHGLIVVLGHSRRPTATALKRIVRDVRLLPSTLFHAARAVTIPRQGSHTVWRTAYGTVTGTCRSNRKFLALEEAARAGDALAGRRAAAMRQVAATAVYHGVASVEGTNKDKCGNETVALVSVARPAPRCSLDAKEPPRVLLAVCTATRTPGFFGHDGQIYERFGVYAVLGAGPANERRASLVDAAWKLLDPEGAGFVERADFFNAFDASRHPRVLEERPEYREGCADDEDRSLEEWYESFAGAERVDHVSRREFQTYYAERSDDVEDDEAFERELDVWTAGETLSVERSSDPASPSPLRPCSRLVRLVHASEPQAERNRQNDDDHEHLHTATAATCNEVAERLGVDVECLGYVIKAVVLAANLRGRDGREWEKIERLSEGYPPSNVEFCETFPRFGRDRGRRTDRDWIEYPRGEDLFYYRYDPPTFEGRKAADHELDFDSYSAYESSHGLLRHTAAEVSTRVDLTSCATLAALHDKLRGWRDVVRARLRRQHHEVDPEDYLQQDYFAFAYTSQVWRGV